MTEGKIKVGSEEKNQTSSAPGSSASEKPLLPPRGNLSRQAVALADDDLLLAAGNRVSINVPAGQPVGLQSLSAPDVIVVPVDEIRRKLAWQERRLEFEAAELAEMAEEFNRYHRRKLVIADLRLAAKRFGGSFKPDDQAGFVRMLQENFNVVVEERDGDTVLRLKPD